MTRILASIAFLLANVFAHGQDKPYQFQVENLKDSVVYLANYYGEKLYYSDTAYADANGKFAFKRVEEEKEGKYAVVIPGPKYFEIVIADGEDISMKTDTASPSLNVEVMESANNKLLYDYMGFLTERRKERDALLKALEENEGNPERTAAIKTEFNALNDRVLAYQRKLGEDNPNLFAAKEILMSLEPEPPLEIRDDKSAAYYYYKNNYFKYIDLKDDRIIRSPVFHGRFTNYLNKTLIQHPDTIIEALDKLIVQLEKGSEVFKYVVHYATYNYETSKIMGMDKVFVHMVDNYYKPGVAYWMDDEKLETIRNKADEKRYTLIGLKAPELILADTAGNWISTYKDSKKKYTLLFFYDPDCGHCKKDTPKLVEMYKNREENDLDVFAVSSENGKKWTEFIKKNGMEFFNLSIPQKAYEDANYATSLITSGKTNYKSLKYHETFDVFSTPKIFLLDENKIIRAKDISIDQVEEFIARLEGKPLPTAKDEEQ